MCAINLLIVLFLLFGSQPYADGAESADPCPEKWFYDDITGGCYYISDNQATFQEAKKKCESLKSYLTTDSSLEEKQFLIASLFAKRRECNHFENCHDFWMGLQYSDNNWVWTDGSPVTKTYWYPTYPIENANCGFIYLDAISRSWKNAICTNSHRFVCKLYCPKGFTYDPETSVCYQIIPEKLSWDSAYKRCESITVGAHPELAIVIHAPDIKAINKHLQTEIEKTKSLCSDPKQKSSFWIGAKRKNADDCENWYRWKTPKGTVLMEFSNWGKNQPVCKVDSEKCVQVSKASGFKWSEDDCKALRCPLCELRRKSF